MHGVADSPSLIEARARRVEATLDLEHAIHDGFEEYRELERRLNAFTARLAVTRAHLRHAGYLTGAGQRPARDSRPVPARGARRARRRESRVPIGGTA